MYYEGLNLYTEGAGMQIGKEINGYCKEGYYRLSPSSLVIQGTCNVLLQYENVFGECTSEYFHNHMLLIPIFYFPDPLFIKKPKYQSHVDMIQQHLICNIYFPMM